MVNWRAYFELCKPRVVALMLITAFVGMLLASQWSIPWRAVVFGMLGIGLAACAGGALNHLIDRRLDALMYRTHSRPIPTGQVSALRAGIFAAVLGMVGLAILLIFVNSLTAWLTVATLISYAVIYTIFLKHATPQNIVLGGLAGAMPPLLGWTAVMGDISYAPLLLVLIIFVWTPPHFWALAIYRHEEYSKADIPMLPVTHGVPFTKLNILLYTILLFVISLLPVIVDMSGLIYLVGAVLLGIGFMYWALRLYRSSDKLIAMKTFRYSIIYLLLLFIFLLVDHYLPFLI